MCTHATAAASATFACAAATDMSKVTCVRRGHSLSLNTPGSGEHLVSNWVPMSENSFQNNTIFELRHEVHMVPFSKS
jgi:hypothetical protein